MNIRKELHFDVQLLFLFLRKGERGRSKMILTHKITLSLDQRGDRPCIDAVCGDTARAIEITLLENGEAWAIPQGVTAVVSYRRVRGGAGGIYDSMEGGAPACILTENRVTVHLAPQVLAVAGPVELQVMLLRGESALSCFSILIHVQGNLSDATKDEEYYVNLTDHIRQILDTMDLKVSGSTVHYIVGDATSTSGTWKGTCPEISRYYDGLIVSYRTVATGGSSSTTLNINGLGAIPVKRNGLSGEVTYVYGKGSVLLLTYVVIDGTACWQLADQWFSDTDKKTSATSASGTKLYLVGAKSMSATGVTTYANSSCYVGEDNCLYSGGEKVLTMESLPSDVPAYVQAEADRVATLVQSRQTPNTVSFMLGSDLHARVGLEGSINSQQMLESTLHGAQGMKILADRVHLDFVGLLGDYIWDGEGTEMETTAQAMEMYRLIGEYFSPAFRGMPQFWCKGNHDMLYNGSQIAKLTANQMYATIGIRNDGNVFDEENAVQGYCHRDLPRHKLRIICMNTSETYNTAVNTAQIAWLNTVLDMADGWKAIILSHIPLDWWGSSSTVFQTVASHAEKVLCNIHGHVHNYVVGTLGDTGIPRVAIPNMDFYRPNTYATNATFGESVSYPKTANTAQDTAFCVITVNLDTNTLYADHFGAGYDRVVALNAEAVGNGSVYTNRISMSTSVFNGTEIYNGVGYKAGVRIGSSEDFPETTVNGMCSTGYISVKEGDILRVKNVTLSGSATPYVVRYDSTGGCQATESVSVLGSPDANGVYTYVIPEKTGAIRLSLGVIDGNSVVTVNEPIF